MYVIHTKTTSYRTSQSLLVLLYTTTFWFFLVIIMIIMRGGGYTKHANWNYKRILLNKVIINLSIIIQKSLNALVFSLRNQIFETKFCFNFSKSLIFYMIFWWGLLFGTLFWTSKMLNILIFLIDYFGYIIAMY